MRVIARCRFAYLRNNFVLVFRRKGSEQTRKFPGKVVGLRFGGLWLFFLSSVLSLKQICNRNPKVIRNTPDRHRRERSALPPVRVDLLNPIASLTVAVGDLRMELQEVNKIFVESHRSFTPSIFV